MSPKQIEIPGAGRVRDDEIEHAIEKMLEHMEASKLRRVKALECREEARRLIAEKGLPCYRYWDGETSYIVMPTSKESLSVKKEKGTEVEAADDRPSPPKRNGKSKGKKATVSKGKPKARGKKSEADAIPF